MKPLSLAGLLGLLLFTSCSRQSPGPSGSESPRTPAAALEARERRADETVWAKEMLAQRCGEVVESFWDSLNAATNKLALAAQFPVGQVVLGVWDQPKPMPHQIELRASTRPGPVLTGGAWKGFVEQFQRAGWELHQCEFRHNQFDVDARGQAVRSRFYFSAHLTNPLRVERAIVEGDLTVDWAPAPKGSSTATKVQRVDASSVTIKNRRGDGPFQLLLSKQVSAPEGLNWVDPLMIHDLDGDGSPEIILLARNLVFQRSGDGTFQGQDLCRHPSEAVFTGMFADFNGDGETDLLAAVPKGLAIYLGPTSGTFEQSAQVAWAASLVLINPMALTAGDIDQDGDLDVFLGQYRVPTLGQVLSPNYYDANDGHPSYLLLNDGHGRFTDHTTDAGLDQKRRRRVFSASFVDLDRDGGLDLLTSSDFSGADVYRNNGSGAFEDVTERWLPDPKAFGMGQTVADFNQDGRLDLLVLGMTSPTADRLEHLRLERPLPEADPAMRRRMSFGNRLFIGSENGGFEQTSYGDVVARSGWSWGCSAFDCDNDGFPDIYITNGHDSRRTVREYEPEFWLHDIFIDRSIDDVTATPYYMAKFGRTRGQGWSYGGFDKNRLYLNLQGSTFFEAAYLFGVGTEEDSRCVATADFDRDGRMDLVFTTFQQWPEPRHTLHVYRNDLPATGQWIGFQLSPAPGSSAIGAEIRIRSAGREATRTVITGDSFRSQHECIVHFGLGSVTNVDEVQIRWPNGQRTEIKNPAVNHYHRVKAERTAQR